MDAERVLSPAEHIRDLEAFLICQHVYERQIDGQTVVHDAEDWILLKVGNRRVAADDADTDRSKFECEYYIFMDTVEQRDIQLQKAKFLVGLQDAGSSDGASVHRNYP